MALLPENLFPPGTSPGSTTTEDDRATQDEAEIIPSAIVVGFIDGDGLREQRNDEGERADEPVPQPLPETCHFSLIGGCVRQGIGLGGTACQDQQKQKNSKDDYNFFHKILLFPPLYTKNLQNGLIKKEPKK
jgi:hypothetical protein